MTVVSTRRMPGEWEHHSATWIFWPTSAERYVYGSLASFAEVRSAFVCLIDVLSAFEPVYLGVDPTVIEEAKAAVGRRATIHEIPMDDAWARDTAPTFILENGHPEAICWRFAGWGGRFEPYAKDAKAAASVAEIMNVDHFSSPLELEGGAINSDGRGSLLTTAPVLNDPRRNHGQDSGFCEAALQEALGVSRLIALPAGFSGDDTGGHVDVVATFDPLGRVLLNHCKDWNDPNSGGTADNATFLKDLEIEVIRIPQPAAEFFGNGRLPFSYLNHYLCNDGLILPRFGDKKDDYVRDLMAEVYPDRDMVQFDARPFYSGGGGLHCVTQPVFSGKAYFDQ
ncbi:MAG: agmatine deiminase family protein [Verrucomicrobiota bacterium]